jgi:hypothetical protein
MSAQNRRGELRFFWPTGKREKAFVPDVKMSDKKPRCLCDHWAGVHQESDRWYIGNQKALVCTVPGCGCVDLRPDAETQTEFMIQQGKVTASMLEKAMRSRG